MRGAGMWDGLGWSRHFWELGLLSHPDMWHLPYTRLLEKLSPGHVQVGGLFHRALQGHRGAGHTLASLGALCHLTAPAPASRQGGR